MFTNLMKQLHNIYEGDVIYLPDKIQMFIEPWLKQQAGNKRMTITQRQYGFQSGNPETSNGYHYQGKKVIFFDEDNLVAAYKTMPIPHKIETVCEEPFVIEFTLENMKRCDENSKPWQHNAAKKVEKRVMKGGDKLW